MIFLSREIDRVISFEELTLAIVSLHFFSNATRASFFEMFRNNFCSFALLLLSCFEARVKFALADA